jgi:dihydrofolate reductase
MAKIILYIASSLDGYIAKPDGNLDWLNTIPPPKAGGDYGYSNFLRRIGPMVMGRKTYETILGFGGEWPYEGHSSYVVTRQNHLVLQSPETSVLSGDWVNQMKRIKQESNKDIWLIGGGELITAFINGDLLDEIILTLIPKLIGDGIPLFAGKTLESEWELKGSIPYDTGLVSLTYTKK